MKHSLTVIAEGALLGDVREKPDGSVVWFHLRHDGSSQQDFVVTYAPRTDKERQYLLRVLKKGAHVHVVSDMTSKMEGEGENARIRLLLAAYRCEVRMEATAAATPDDRTATLPSNRLPDISDHDHRIHDAGSVTAATASGPPAASSTPTSQSPAERGRHTPPPTSNPPLAATSTAPPLAPPLKTASPPLGQSPSAGPAVAQSNTVFPYVNDPAWC